MAKFSLNDWGLYFCPGSSFEYKITRETTVNYLNDYRLCATSIRSSLRLNGFLASVDEHRAYSFRMVLFSMAEDKAKE